MKKRIVSLLLALVMVLSLVPTTVWAAEDHDGQVRVIVKNRPTQRPTALPGMARWWTSGWTWFPGPP